MPVRPFKKYANLSKRLKIFFLFIIAILCRIFYLVPVMNNTTHTNTTEIPLQTWMEIQMHNAERSCHARLLQDLGERFLAEIDSSDLLDGMPWNWKGFIQKGSFEIVTK
jgi:hypothetical protein